MIVTVCTSLFSHVVLALSFVSGVTMHVASVVSNLRGCRMFRKFISLKSNRKQEVTKSFGLLSRQQLLCTKCLLVNKLSNFCPPVRLSKRSECNLYCIIVRTISLHNHYVD